MPVTKWDIEEQITQKADEMAHETYGQEFDALPLPTRCKIMDEASQIITIKWQEGLARLQEALDDR